MLNAHKKCNLLIYGTSPQHNNCLAYVWFWLEKDAVRLYVKALFICVRQEKFPPSFFKLSYFSQKHRSLPLHARLPMRVRREELSGGWSLFPYDPWCCGKAEKATKSSFTSHVSKMPCFFAADGSIRTSQQSKGRRAAAKNKNCYFEVHVSQASAQFLEIGLLAFVTQIDNMGLILATYAIFKF